MALDALERERLRRRMATKMGIFLEAGTTASCVSSHFLEEPGYCELCETVHTDELIVIKNRSGKKLRLASTCLLEMVRYKVVDVDDLSRWLDKVKAMRAESDKRREDLARQRDEDRRRLEKKVIVRRRGPHPGA